MSRSKKDLVSRISKPFTSAKVVANNTLEIQYEDGTKAIRLHDTDVVVFNQDGSVTLDSGGYRTKVTKDRINQFQNETHLSTKSHVWYLDDGSVFEDGITLKNRAVISNRGADAKNVIVDMKKKIDEFVKLIDDDMPMPNRGDCWFCSMYTVESGKPLGDETGDHGHLRTHIDEGYMHGSLIVNALKEAGVNDNGIRFVYFAGLRDQAKRAVKKYLMRRVVFKRW